jgi:thiamine biosynthesis lipoprotein
MSAIRSRFSGKTALPCLLALWIAACGGPAPEGYSETREQMGTLVSITVPHPDRRAAVEEAFAEIDRIESLLSTYIGDSEISRLNREGAVTAGGDLEAVVRRALHFHSLSGGAFDVTVKPVIDLRRERFEVRGAPPEEAELAGVAGLVDAEGIRIGNGSIVLPPGVEITLDGIAKGYAVDRAVEILKRHGVNHALVNAGGDVRAMGTKGGAPWKVALQSPRDPGDYLAVIDLSDRSVATSGDYRRYFDPDMKHHHILDPRTGRSARELISVTVTARTAMDADALSTAVFVLGPEKGLELVEGLEGVEALVVTSDREVLHTSGW